MLIFRVTRYVGEREAHNTLGRALLTGEILYEFTGATYGCCDRTAAHVVTLNRQGKGEFFELPLNAARIVGCDHAHGYGPHCIQPTCAAWIGRCALHGSDAQEPCSLDPTSQADVFWQTVSDLEPGGTMTEPTDAIPKLTLQDRCDQCGAEALARLIKGLLLLDFCGHHFRDHEITLETSGWTVAESRVPSLI